MIKLKNINLNEVKKQYQENGFVVLKNFFEKKTNDNINSTRKTINTIKTSRSNLRTTLKYTSDAADDPD